MAKRRSIRPLALGVLALGLALAGQTIAEQREYPADALILFASAIAVFVLTLGRLEFGQSPDRAMSSSDVVEAPSAEVVPPSSLSWQRWLDRFEPDHFLAGGLAFGVLGLITNQDNGFTVVSGFSFLASVALALLGAVRADRMQKPMRATEGTSGGLPFRTEVWIIFALTVLAAFLRWYRLDAIPSGLFFDEAMYGLDARQVREGGGFLVYFPDNFGRGGLFIYLVAGLFSIFSEQALTLRLAASILGILAIPAMYLMAREMFGWRAGIVAGFLLAVSRWHINFSRIAFDAIGLPVFELLAFYFLARAWRSGRRVDFALAGLCLGLGLHTYAAFRLVPFIAVAFLAHLWLTTPRTARRSAWDLGLAALVLLLIAAPLIQFGLRHPDVINSRVQTASVFSSRTTSEGLAAAMENTRKHLLMFNVEGDHNGRHNLPGEPMLDPASAALLVVGVGFAASRWRRPQFLLLFIWAAVGLSGGVFSLDFEAPQSLRSMGALPAIIVFASLPLALLWEEAASVAGRQGLKALTAAGAAGLALVAFANYQTYFDRQANDFAVWNAFSTAESLEAREMQRLGAGWRFYVTSLHVGHPTIRFLAPNVENVQRFETNDTLPLPEDGSAKVALFLDDERASIYRDARKYYPEATFQEYGLPNSPTVMYAVMLSQQDVARIQGLQARYYVGAQWDAQPIAVRQESKMTIDWAQSSPLPAPFGVEWEGVLRVPAYGTYTLGLRSPADLKVWLDGSAILEGSGKAEGQFQLAKGNHSVRYRATIPQTTGQTVLYWRPPGGSAAPMPRSVLYTEPVTSNGLLGSYYQSDDWSGPTALQQIDPRLGIYFHNTPLKRPYTVTWTGKLAISQSGVYRFGLECIGDTWLYVDEKAVLEAHEGNRLVESAGIPLQAGYHDIQVRFADRYGFSHINVYWMPPNGQRELIPTEALFPPQGEYPAAAVAPPQPKAEAPKPTGEQLPTAQKVVAVWGAGGTGNAEFGEPRDVALDKSGNAYVADTANSRVVKINSEGEVVTQWGQNGEGDAEFVEPLAIVVDSQGNVYVLDSDPGWVKKFSADGAFIARWGGPDLALYHPRGMAIGPDDVLYIADTGGSRILKLSPDGQKLGTVGHKGEVEPAVLQPTDVDVGPNGDVYVADSETSMVQVYDPSGLPIGQWPIPAAGSVNGQHLAVAPDGSVYVTAPNDHLVLRFSAGGEMLGQVGGRGDSPGLFNTPVGVLTDTEGHVYVVDTMNHRVQKLGP